MSTRPGLLAAVLAAVWAIGAAGECSVQGPGRPRFVEDEIAGIHIGVDRSDDIVQLYGHGFKAGGSSAEQFCYWDESRQLGVKFGLDVGGVVDVVNVAAIPDQIDQACRKANLRIARPLATGKAVAMGDSLESVLVVYGEPANRVDGVARGQRFVALEYEVRHERTPGVARWYWAALLFFDGKLTALQVIEASQSVSKALRRAR